MLTFLPPRDRVLAKADLPIVMGILNVTPDSFSDGGLYGDADAATGRGLQMLDEGAVIVDVGPESTRPGAQPVEGAEQVHRAVPVIRRIRQARPAAVLSIDTRLADVAGAAIDAGADLVNDTSALRDDPGMARLVAERQVGIVLMHRRGTPADMQEGGGPHYDDLVGEITAFFQERCDYAMRCGIRRERIVLDPGIGFGKRLEHNLAILNRLDRFVALGFPILIGASRKRFIGEITGATDPQDRLPASLACAVLAAEAGAAILRVHDVAPTAAALRLRLAAALGLLERLSNGNSSPRMLSRSEEEGTTRGATQAGRGWESPDLHRNCRCVTPAVVSVGASA